MTYKENNFVHHCLLARLVENIVSKEKEIEQIEKELVILSERYIYLQEEKTWQEKIERKEGLKKELANLEKKILENKNIYEELETIENKFEEVIKKVQELQTKKEYISPLIKERENRLNELKENKEEIQKIEAEINQIKKHGGEAISINGQTVSQYSAIALAGSHINVNFTPIVQPYEIKVIGNTDALNKYTNDSNGEIEYMRSYGLNIDIKSHDMLTIEGIPREKELKHIVVD